MNSYSIRYSCAIFYLIYQAGLALQTSIKTKGQNFLLDLNELPSEEWGLDSNTVPLEELGLDLNTVPPEEVGLGLNMVPLEQSSITSPCSTSPREAFMVSGAELNSPREQVSPVSAATHDFGTISHFPTIASKRKGIHLDVGQTCTSGKRHKAKFKQQSGGNMIGPMSKITLDQLLPKYFQITQANPVPTETPEDALNAVTHRSPEVGLISDYPEIINIYDWNWIVVDPTAETENNSHCQETTGKLNPDPNIFKYLNSLRREPLPGRLFWIPKGHEQDYLATYHANWVKKHLDSSIIPEIRPSPYNSGILHIIMRISDEKLYLESNMHTFLEIWARMKLRFDQKDRSEKQVKVAVDKRTSYLKKMVKITTTLGKLNKQHIPEFMLFIKHIFKQCEKYEAPTFNSNKDHAKKWHDLLNFRYNDSKSPIKDLALAWSTIQYWLEKTTEMSRLAQLTCHKDAALSHQEKSPTAPNLVAQELGHKVWIDC
ncbi:hypothetical protein H4Q26_013905 [Puccinia striiformis f. sp. tritici PST-130]|nr:hypothetical protein H4Q26_013905 [Puccinia striiformis f. sp. tritici PST-130]